ncbi:sigma-70 family RNA polymerase sigma factor [Clostridiaceae bacterium 35-E11]
MIDRMQVYITNCKKKDVLGQEVLLEKLKPLIFTSIKRYYFGKEAFEDLVQEGYMKILQEIERFDEERGVPFLGYIKLQLKFFYMEKGKRERHTWSLNQQLDVGDDSIAFLDMLRDETVDIEKDMIQEEEMFLIKQGIQQLSYKQREVIELYFYKRMNMRQIAQQLGVHYKTVAKRKKTALQKLRESLRI